MDSSAYINIVNSAFGGSSSKLSGFDLSAVKIPSNRLFTCRRFLRSPTSVAFIIFSRSSSGSRKMRELLKIYVMKVRFRAWGI